MIDALIAGKLYGQPAERTSKTGKPFAVAKVRAAAGDGESLFVNVIAFDAGPCAALLALADGDSVALAGSITPKVWTDKRATAAPAWIGGRSGLTRPVQRAPRLQPQAAQLGSIPLDDGEPGFEDCRPGVSESPRGSSRLHNTGCTKVAIFRVALEAPETAGKPSCRRRTRRNGTIRHGARVRLR